MHVVYNCKIHSNLTNGRVETIPILLAFGRTGISAGLLADVLTANSAPKHHMHHNACDVHVSDAKFIRQRPEIQKATQHESQIGIVTIQYIVAGIVWPKITIPVQVQQRSPSAAAAAAGVTIEPHLGVLS